MPAYVAPSTRATGYVVLATDWNVIVNDILATRQIVGMMRRAAAQSINDSSSTAISFDTQDIDDENYIDVGGAPTRLTFPRKGIYLLDVEVQFASNATGYRVLTMPRSGGASDFTMNIMPVNGAITVLKFPLMTGERAAGDYYEFKVWQNSTGALNITARVGVSMLQDRT
jgi:hypothetical protein